MNFILSEMTFLRYYMPLIIEAKSRGHRSKLFVGANNKYNNPRSFVDHIEKLSNVNEFEILDIEHAHKCTGVTFLIEGVDHKRLDQTKTTSVSMTYMTDYSSLYNSYIDNVDYVVFPSEYFANIYNKKSPKNLYLGSPKYDLVLNEKEIKNKYNLTNNKKALIIYPRNRDKNKVDLNRIYSNLKELGYDILVKSRGKDPIYDQAHKGDTYYSDKSWFPHTTMEFIKVSDIIINFNSTSIKECVLLRKPLLNFGIKPWMPLEELYDYEYCRRCPVDFADQELKESIEYLAKTDLTKSFDAATQNHLFTGNSSKRILDHLGIL